MVAKNAYRTRHFISFFLIFSSQFVAPYFVVASLEVSFHVFLCPSLDHRSLYSSLYICLKILRSNSFEMKYAELVHHILKLLNDDVCTLCNDGEHLCFPSNS